MTTTNRLPEGEPHIGSRERTQFELVPYQDLITSKLQSGYSAKAVWRWLKSGGITSISYATFCRFLQAQRANQPSPAALSSEPDHLVRPTEQTKPKKVRSTPSNPVYHDSVPRDSNGRVLTIREQEALEQQKLHGYVESILKVQREKAAKRQKGTKNEYSTSDDP